MAEKTNPKDQKLEASFSTLVMSFGVQAYVGLGLTPHPEFNEVRKDKDLAQLNIDFLAVILEKTKNNLSAQENDLITKMLNDLRMKFVQTQW